MFKTWSNYHLILELGFITIYIVYIFRVRVYGLHIVHTLNIRVKVRVYSLHMVHTLKIRVKIMGFRVQFYGKGLVYIYT
jgi:hypothetical protein